MIGEQGAGVCSGSSGSGRFVRRGFAAAAAIAIVLVGACADAGSPETSEVERVESVGSSTVAFGSTSSRSSGPPQFGFAGSVLTDLPPVREGDSLQHETERDWAIAQGTVEWAWSQGLETLPIQEVAAILGTTFVGTPYEPGSLELPGPEALVINLRGFDCVTFIEHLLVLSRIAVEADPEVAADSSRFRDRYRDELTRVRYRGGVLDGYPSRLHYFSDWIRDAEAKGLVRDLTRELGGVEDTRPIHFMSSHPQAYRQLNENADYLQAIREIEQRLGELPRYYIPQERIAEVEAGIQSGDIIAAVSTLDGLDVAHTGIALRHEGRIHLMHAPLVGDSVEISTRPLADRIQGISGQKGIMVARMRSPGSD